jgi:hypothetical protein
MKLLRTNSKKLVLCVLALVALVGAGAAYTAASPSAKLQKQDRVYGGGQYGPGCFSDTDFCYAFPRNIAVDAHAEGNGAEASGNETYGHPDVPQASRRMKVTCLRVEGNKAAVGGIIEEGPDAGFWYVRYLVDRGGPGGTTRDLASPLDVDVAGSPYWAGIPGFPYACPSPATGVPNGGPPIYRELDEGDIVVQDAPSD